MRRRFAALPCRTSRGFLAVGGRTGEMGREIDGLRVLRTFLLLGFCFFVSFVVGSRGLRGVFFLKRVYVVMGFACM